MTVLPEDLSIGELALRSGVAPSALRFYEERGLLRARRTTGNQRRFPRAALRRVALIKAAQAAGISLRAIAQALASLPADRDPTLADWRRLSAGWRTDLDRRIAELTGMRDRLTSCIGCGCLSLRKCHLFNPGDKAAAAGPGAAWLADQSG